jgi:excisionase family DNA binding protein
MANLILENQKTTFLSLQDAAAFLHITPSTLYKWCMTRKIVYYKSGKRNLFKEEDLLAFLNRTIVAPDEVQVRAFMHLQNQQAA